MLAAINNATPLIQQLKWLWEKSGKITLRAAVYIGFTAGIPTLLQPHVRQWASV